MELECMQEELRRSITWFEFLIQLSLNKNVVKDIKKDDPKIVFFIWIIFVFLTHQQILSTKIH